jgi:hypothetical protein
MDHGRKNRNRSRWLASPDLLGAVLLASLLAASAARADDGGLLVHEADLDGRITRQERPFGFLTDGSTPSRGVVSLGYAFGVGSGISAERPLPVNLAAGAGGSHTATLGYGLTPQLAPFASATFTESTLTPGSMSSTFMAGAIYQLTRPAAPLHVSLSGAVAHEGASQATGVSSLAAVSFNTGPLCLAANLRADKMFAAGRDSVDLFTMLGVSYRVVGGLRLGVEYVGQDLEDAFEADLEGGARHAVGPNLALDLDGGRYQVILASGFGLNAASPTAVVRAGLTLNY